jgi:hypothetical protein
MRGKCVAKIPIFSDLRNVVKVLQMAYLCRLWIEMEQNVTTFIKIVNFCTMTILSRKLNGAWQVRGILVNKSDFIKLFFCTFFHFVGGVKVDFLGDFRIRMTKSLADIFQGVTGFGK